MPDCIETLKYILCNCKRFTEFTKQTVKSPRKNERSPVDLRLFIFIFVFLRLLNNILNFSLVVLREEKILIYFS